MIPFNPDYLEQTSFLKPSDIEEIDNNIDFTNLKRGEKTLFSKLYFDAIYFSAKIEGNTYTKIETEDLIERNQTAPYKSLDDANQIINIRKAFDYVLEYKPEISKKTIKEIHSILSEAFLPKKNQGNARDIPVSIGGSDYIPTTIPDQLESSLDIIINNYNSIQNPFDKAIYIHNNIAYLQYFLDCNKRLARMLQNLSLIRDNKAPFTLTGGNEKLTINNYKDALISYYEKGDYKPYKHFFIDQYKKGLELIKYLEPSLANSLKR